MLFHVKFLVLFLLAHIFCSSQAFKDPRVRCSEKMKEERSAALSSMELPRVGMFFVVGFTIIKNGFSNDSSVRKDLIDHDPTRIVSVSFDENENRGKFVNSMADFRNALRYHFISVNGNETVSHSSSCRGLGMKFFVAISNRSKAPESGIALLHACKLSIVKNSANKSESKVENSVILLIEGKSLEVDFVQAMKIFSQNHKVIDLKYNDFDDEGFCICKEQIIFHYFNECPFVFMNANEVKILVIFILIAGLALMISVKGFNIVQEFLATNAEAVVVPQNHRIIQVQPRPEVEARPKVQQTQTNNSQNANSENAENTTEL